MTLRRIVIIIVVVALVWIVLMTALYVAGRLLPVQISGNHATYTTTTTQTH